MNFDDSHNLLRHRQVFIMPETIAESKQSPSDKMMKLNLDKYSVQMRQVQLKSMEINKTKLFQEKQQKELQHLKGNKHSHVRPNQPLANKYAVLGEHWNIQEPKKFPSSNNAYWQNESASRYAYGKKASPHACSRYNRQNINHMNQQQHTKTQRVKKHNHSFIKG